MVSPKPLKRLVCVCNFKILHRGFVANILQISRQADNYYWLEADTGMEWLRSLVMA